MKSSLYPTMNDLPEKTRHGMVELLNQSLSHVLDLGLQAKQAHWNVKGPNFVALHGLFDKVAEELEESADTIAERTVALGGVARGTLQAVASRSHLAPYPLNIASGANHVAALSAGLAKFGKSIRLAIAAATQAGDADTADLFTEVSRQADRLLWMVEAHMQSKE